MSGYRNPYTSREERKMLRYIIRKKAYHRLRGLQIWKEMSRDVLPKRTHQSLHQRFRKFVINNLQNPAYELTHEEQKKIKDIYDELAKPKKKPEGKTEKKNTRIFDSDSEEDFRAPTSNLAPNFIEMDSEDSENEAPNDNPRGKVVNAPENGDESEIESSCSNSSEIFSLNEMK